MYDKSFKMKFVRHRSRLLKVLCTIVLCITLILCFAGKGFDTIVLEKKQSYKNTKEVMPQSVYESVINWKSETIRTPATRLLTTPVNQFQLTSKSNQRLLSCDEIFRLLSKAKTSKTTIHSEENTDGNRGVFYSILRNPTLEIVIKETTIRNLSDSTEIYRHNAASKEIKNLEILRELQIDGAPRLLGSCVEKNHLAYVVTRIDGEPVCGENGTDMSCVMTQNILRSITAAKNPSVAALTWLAKSVCFFSQLEYNKIFMEDVSGSNFFYSPKTWDLFIVDADSLIFYGDSPLLSRVSCRSNNDCPRPYGNFWPAHALNRKIYYGCGEMYGVCKNNTCQGVGSKLHTCGIGHWFVTALRSVVPIRVYNDYRKLKTCMTVSDPFSRCSLRQACSDAKRILSMYVTDML